MSDNTTDTPESHVDGVEPSMEDILASIRRIIADDDQASANFSGEMAAGAVVTAAQTSEASVSKDLEPQALDIDLDTEGELEVLALDPVDTLEGGNEATELGGLLDDDLSEIEELLLTDMADDEAAAVVETKGTDSNRLTGLAGLAAAGLGAVSAAGTGAAQAITAERQNPSPESPSPESAADLSSPAEAPKMEDLDLVLDDIMGDGSDDVDDLDALLQIPDEAEEEAPVDDLDRLLSNMLGDSPADTFEPSEDFVVDPAADLIAEGADEDAGDDIDDLLSDLIPDDAPLAHDEISDGADAEMVAQSDPDLDLVKSLMADLTDDPYPETAAEEAAAEDEAEQEDNVLDEILSLSMDDEVNLQEDSLQGDAEHESLGEDDLADILAPLEDDVDAPEAQVETSQDNSPFFIDINDDLSKPAEPKSSLSELADSAKAEAERLKNRGFSTGQFAAGAGVAIAASGPLAALVTQNGSPEQNGPDQNDTEQNDTVETAAETEFSDDAEMIAEHLNIEITPDTPPKEIADMAKAKAKDTIVDNVTEDATASAFASLNKVVDDNALMADRGDRIGDLVQEALRPMLKEWLDKNLKTIVERAVTKEVKRISSGK